MIFARDKPSAIPSTDPARSRQNISKLHRVREVVLRATIWVLGLGLSR
jgi:hypothetical protein